MYANHLIRNKKDTAKAVAVLDMMNKQISYTQFPMSFDAEYRIAQLYKEAGAQDKAELFAGLGIKSCEVLISNTAIAPEYGYYEAMGRRVGPYTYAAYLYEMRGDYNGAIESLEKLKAYSNQLLPMLQGNQSEYVRVYSRIAEIESMIVEFKMNDAEKNKGPEEAIKLGYKLIEEFEKSNQEYKQNVIQFIQNKIYRLSPKEGIVQLPGVQP